MEKIIYETILNWTSSAYFSEALTFFILDTTKVFVLLFAITFVVSLIRSYLPPEKIRAILAREKTGLGNFSAAALGIVTPFCTCSAIPLFLGFLEAGVPLGITFSFLIASPMINEVALVLLFGLFGWKVAAIYVASGMLIAIIAGMIIEKMKLEHLLEDLAKRKRENLVFGEIKISWKERIFQARVYTLDIVRKVWIYIVIGLGVAAIIHGYVPNDLLARYASGEKWYGVPLAVILGVPLYSNAAGILPLAGVMVEKGMSLGTVLAFMMAVTGLSLPEFMILRKVMKTKLIAIFAGIVAAGIMLTGYLFNAIL